VRTRSKAISSDGRGVADAARRPGVGDELGVVAAALVAAADCVAPVDAAVVGDGAEDESEPAQPPSTTAAVTMEAMARWYRRRGAHR